MNDASCHTDKGISLNDVQLLGPKLQMDMDDIVMRFRRHRLAICADIKKNVQPSESEQRAMEFFETILDRKI